MKARIKFRKFGILRFIGHLDVMRFFQKAMRRAEIPIAFTSGYSPHMIMSFAQPLGLGITSEAEYLDVELAAPIASEEAVHRLNQVMVEGIDVLSFRQIPDDKKSSGMTIVAAADYLIFPKTEDSQTKFPDSWEETVEAFMAQPSIFVVKKTKRSEKEVDIRPMIYQFSITDNHIFLSLAAGSEANLKPDLVMDTFQAFTGEKLSLQYHRKELYAKQTNGGLCSLESLGTEIIL